MVTYIDNDVQYKIDDDDIEQLYLDGQITPVQDKTWGSIYQQYREKFQDEYDDDMEESFSVVTTKDTPVTLTEPSVKETTASTINPFSETTVTIKNETTNPSLKIIENAIIDFNEVVMNLKKDAEAYHAIVKNTQRKVEENKNMILKIKEKVHKDEENPIHNYTAILKKQLGNLTEKTYKLLAETNKNTDKIAELVDAEERKGNGIIIIHGVLNTLLEEKTAGKNAVGKLLEKITSNTKKIKDIEGDKRNGGSKLEEVMHNLLAEIKESHKTSQTIAKNTKTNQQRIIAIEKKLGIKSSEDKLHELIKKVIDVFRSGRLLTESLIKKVGGNLMKIKGLEDEEDPLMKEKLGKDFVEHLRNRFE